jgi:uncharacterized protein (DUF427 family)
MESVWDYPRPPRLEAVAEELRVEHAGIVIARTVRGHRVLETSHPPTYYFPHEDVDWNVLARGRSGGSMCEWKGSASYVDLRVGDRVVRDVAWFYPRPTPAFAPIAGALAFYASRVDACYVGGERVQAQEGDFYGGWITSRIAGPFKGAPGTRGW